LAAEYKDRIRIYKINADKNEKTVHTYSVYELPTILFFDNGQIIDHVIGIISKNNLIARIEGILDSAACTDS
jgi:thioredoxin 1